MTGNQITVSALDFVAAEDKEKLDNFLLAVTGRETPPESVDEIEPESIQLENEAWGEIENGLEEFKTLRLDVLVSGAVTDVYFVVLTGIISASYMGSVWESSNSIQDAQENLRTYWEKRFSDEFPGLINTVDVSSSVGRPVVITTANLDYDLLPALAGSEGDWSREDIYQGVQKELDTDGLLVQLGMPMIGAVSLTGVHQGGVGIIGVENVGSGVFRLGHRKHCFIEISEADGSGPRSFFSSLRHLQPQLVQMLPLIYFQYWFRIQELKLYSYRDSLENISLSEYDIDISLSSLYGETQAFIEAESSFLDKYHIIQKKASEAEQHTSKVRENQESLFRQETPISHPKLAYESASEAPHGAVETQLSAVEGKVESVVEGYHELKQRYDNVSGRVDKIISLKLSQTNTEINKSIRRLTILLVVLAILNGVGFFNWLWSLVTTQILGPILCLI